MRVSVVIPVYNAERYLAKTLESVFAQTCLPDEVIAVNDGSTDGSASVLERYEPRLRVIHQENGGVSQARNRGVDQARGDLVALLDQDDLWYPHKMEKQLKVFAQRPEVSFVYSDVDFIDKEDRIITRRASTEWTVDWMKPFLGNRFHPFPSTVMMKRDLYLAAGGFSAQFAKNSHEDVEFWVRLQDHTEFVFLDEPLVQYRFEHSKTYGKDLDTDNPRWRNTLLLHRLLVERFGADPRMAAPLKDVLLIEGKIESDRCVRLAKRLLLQGRTEDGRRMMREAYAIRKNPKNWGRYLRSLLPASMHRFVF